MVQAKSRTVVVTWTPLSLPEVVSYRIFFSWQGAEAGGNRTADVAAVEVTGTASASVAELWPEASYVFQVAALAEVRGQIIVGEWSEITNSSILTIGMCKCTGHNSSASDHMCWNTGHAVFL